MLETIPSPVFVQDSSGVYRDCNAVFARQIIGLPKEKILGRRNRDLKKHFPQSQQVLLIKKDRQLLRRGGSQFFEASLRCSDGSPRTFFFSRTIFSDPGGSRAGIVTVLTDMTNRQEAERARKESEEKFRIITAAAHDPIAMLDSSGRILLWNKAAERTFGYSSDEIWGNKFLATLVPQHLQKSYRREFGNSTLGKTFEIIILAKDGSQISTELSISAVEIGGQLYAICIFRDITERKAAEAKLQNINLLLRAESENALRERTRLETILRNISDALVVLDRKQRIILVNTAAQTWSGYPSSELLNHSYKILHFVAEQSKKPLQQFVEEVYKKGELVQVLEHTLLIKKDGSTLPVSVSASPLLDSHNKVLGCIIVFRDITREREIDRMKSEFVSVASHQLRTPLTGIKWFADLLLKGKAGSLTPDQADFAQQILSGSQRMIALVNDLLDVSHIDTGRKFFLEKRPAGLPKIIEAVIRDNVVLARERRVKVEFFCSQANKLRFRVDPSKIAQVFHNLINNAIKYSPSGKVVRVNCARTRQGCVFSVRDRGLGIPKDQWGRIFEKFFRADNALLTQTDGTGLGLYIAKAIIEAHGGRIWFKSQEKKGTTFFVQLPVKS